jgi:penicillin-binding protein 1C
MDGHAPRSAWRRRAIIAAAIGLFAPLVAMAGLWAYARSLPPLDLARLNERSTVVLDREGRLLRPFVMADGRWRMPITADAVDPRYLAMLIAYEDKRFWQHGGVDPQALLRAGWQMLTRGRIVSGGSTISMQVARLAEPREARSLGAKLRQIARAIELEQRLGKVGVLDLYLNLAPFGGNLEGVRAASLGYFGREPNRLSTAEAALLVAIPQSPEARRPDRAREGALNARNRVLDRIADARVLPVADIERARDEMMPDARLPFPMHAPHRSEALVADRPDARVIRTSLDRDWQANLQRLARDRAEAAGDKLSVAIVVIENATGAVRASIGGADYFDRSRAGGIDLTRAIRSPGSALKPIIYGLAFEEGIAHPETLVEDRPLRFSGYAPENFDPGFQGVVSARQALQMSLNLPAVDMLQALGPQLFLTRLRAAGADIHLPAASPGGDGAAPGLAIALGGLGISLQDLTMLFAAVARGGDALPASETERPAAASPRALFGPVPAWYLADILRLAPPPDNGPVGRIAFKTGTSYGYRDAFAIGFDRRHTIGVWVGRADNASVPGLVGRRSAAPILFEAFSRIGLHPGLMPRPKEAIVARNAELPPPLRTLRKDQPRAAMLATERAPEIVFPPDGAVIDLAASRIDGRDSVIVKVQGGAAPFTYLIDGTPVGEASTRRALDVTPNGRGFAEIGVLDARGQSHRVRVRLQ